LAKGIPVCVEYNHACDLFRVEKFYWHVSEITSWYSKKQPYLTGDQPQVSWMLHSGYRLGRRSSLCKFISD
jgi:hypothetical protein